MTEYNGWKNYKTWNISLWLTNDEGLYSIAKRFSKYHELIEELHYLGIDHTPDGVIYSDNDVDHQELNDMLAELS